MSSTRILLFTLLFGTLPAGAPAASPDGVIHYDGPISAAHNRRFFETLAGRPLRRLSITSSGGDVAAAIALGEWVYARHLDIEVPDYCLSSCANYVFPAGRHKVIRSGAIVAWHGNYRHLQQTGLWRDDVTARMLHHGEDEQAATRHVRAQVDELTGLERDFFARIGVDEYCLTIIFSPRMPWRASVLTGCRRHRTMRIPMCPGLPTASCISNWNRV
jgi:hypothetical protein